MQDHKSITKRETSMERMMEFRFKVPFEFEFTLHAGSLEDMAFLNGLSPTEAVMCALESDFKEVAFELADQLVEHCNRTND